MVKKIEAQITKYEIQKNKAISSANLKIEKLKSQIANIEQEKKSTIEPLEIKIKQLQSLKKKAEQIENDFSSAIISNTERE